MFGTMSCHQMFETVLKEFHSETETVSTFSFLHERKGVS